MRYFQPITRIPSSPRASRKLLLSLASVLAVVFCLAIASSAPPAQARGGQAGHSSGATARGGSSCTDSSGMTYRRGGSGYETCLRERDRTRQTQRERSQSGGETGSESGSQGLSATEERSRTRAGTTPGQAETGGQTERSAQETSEQQGGTSGAD